MATAEEPASPGINFRELDDEFLQKQAKVWLEAVLEERYGDSLSLADLLADGDILFRVSKRIKELIRTSSGGDAAFPRLPFSETVHDGKGGRYLPYSNVDAFLKMCKRVGLRDVDLFTPPDVVEKKDTRRVCFCIRALSNKARSQHLPVPDFDKVSHTGPMLPTDKVGGIREYLQQAAVASYSPEYKSPRPQSIGKVLSSPGLAGCSFLDTPRSVQSNSSSHSPYSSEELEAPSVTKFVDKSYQEKQSEQANEEEGYAPAKVEEDRQEERSDLDEEEPAEVEEDRQEERSDLDEKERQEEDQAEYHQHLLQEDKENPPVRNGNGLLLAFAIGAVALVASVLAGFTLRPRQNKVPDCYVVKEGDTLSKISRNCGKGTAGWKELVTINPNLAGNPDLIYPTERLKLA